MQAKKSGFRLAAAVTWPPIHSSYCPSFLRIQNEYTINNVIFQNNKIATYSYILFRVIVGSIESVNLITKYLERH